MRVQGELKTGLTGAEPHPDNVNSTGAPLAVKLH